jgi:hypothetical protein
MHRVNFAHCSGVVIDVCREHGTWFDVNELHRIVQFIRAGGLDRSRERQKAALEAERRQIETARLDPGGSVTPDGSGTIAPDLLTVVVEAAGGLVNWWLKK